MLSKSNIHIIIQMEQNFHWAQILLFIQYFKLGSNNPLKLPSTANQHENWNKWGELKKKTVHVDFAEVSLWLLGNRLYAEYR